MFIINFSPDRYPLGDPYLLDQKGGVSSSQLMNNTRVTVADEDAGPTKAWIVTHRNEQEWQTFYEKAYGKRPREELYDITKDPQQLNNVVMHPDYAEVAHKLRSRLMDELHDSDDPRLIDNGSYFEKPPLAGPII